MQICTQVPCRAAANMVQKINADNAVLLVQHHRVHLSFSCICSSIVGQASGMNAYLKNWHSNTISTTLLQLWEFMPKEAKYTHAHMQKNHEHMLRKILGFWRILDFHDISHSPSRNPKIKGCGMAIYEGLWGTTQKR